MGVATAWFVAIVAFWAFRPLTDHVPTTVAPTAAQIAAAQAAGEPAPGRQAGPTVGVECRTPAGSASRNLAEEQVTLAALTDNNGLALTDGQFVRTPCVGAHRQAHILWYANTALYALVVAAMVVVLVRRRRHDLHVPESAFAAA
ncbi:MAG: hypothetical protein QM733_14725 [Ilumatobacteraceae bacterium]